MPRKYTPEEADAAFWAKVDRNGPVPDPLIYGEIGVCWVWTATTNAQGYGRVCRGGRLRPAHQIAFELCGGRASFSNLVILLHECDNPSCCNPAHLHVGTHGDNADEAFRRGRRHSGAPSGERNPQAKLTWVKVREIRASASSAKELAASYDVSLDLIYQIRRREIWKEQSDPTI